MLRLLALLVCLVPLEAATFILVRHAETAGPTGIPDKAESDYSRLVIINTTATPARLLTLGYGQ
jgi:hypothetical protein